jgi:hypothetical protein
MLKQRDPKHTLLNISLLFFKKVLCTYFFIKAGKESLQLDDHHQRRDPGDKLHATLQERPVDHSRSTPTI